jgi:hypothetical protein
MGSMVFRLASSRVPPCDTHPGSVGHVATSTPSSSDSIRALNFMRTPYSS